MVIGLYFLVPNIHVIYQYFQVLQNIRKYFQLTGTKKNKHFFYNEFNNNSYSRKLHTILIGKR